MFGANLLVTGISCLCLMSLLPLFTFTWLAFQQPQAFIRRQTSQLGLRVVHLSGPAVKAIFGGQLLGLFVTAGSFVLASTNTNLLYIPFGIVLGVLITGLSREIGVRLFPDNITVVGPTVSQPPRPDDTVTGSTVRPASRQPRLDSLDIEDAEFRPVDRDEDDERKP